MFWQLSCVRDAQFFISKQVCQCTLLSGGVCRSHVDSFVSLFPFLPQGCVKMKALIDLTLVHSHMYEHMQHQAVQEEGGVGGRMQYEEKSLQKGHQFKNVPK